VRAKALRALNVVISIFALLLACTFARGEPRVELTVLTLPEEVKSADWVYNLGDILLVNELEQCMLRAFGLPKGDFLWKRYISKYENLYEIQGTLYLHTAGDLIRLDPKTGKALWTQTDVGGLAAQLGGRVAGDPSTVTVLGMSQIVFLRSTNGEVLSKTAFSFSDVSRGFALCKGEAIAVYERNVREHVVRNLRVERVRVDKPDVVLGKGYSLYEMKLPFAVYPGNVFSIDVTDGWTTLLSDFALFGLNEKGEMAVARSLLHQRGTVVSRDGWKSVDWGDEGKVRMTYVKRDGTPDENVFVASDATATVGGDGFAVTFADERRSLKMWDLRSWPPAKIGECVAEPAYAQATIWEGRHWNGATCILAGKSNGRILIYLLKVIP